ncbi:MAG: hypothetical protein H8K10_08905 [Nitrospira sp.]|nr:hypothetical protein [Nitrospira sp.]
MSTPTEAERRQPAGRLADADRCVHGRLIDDVLTGTGRRSGTVRCLECGAQLDDPHARKS